MTSNGANNMRYAKGKLYVNFLQEVQTMICIDNPGYVPGLYV